MDTLEQSTRVSSHEESTRDSKQKRVLQVLLVEDAEVLVPELTSQLERLNCHVLVARNGEEALESWATVHFDLLLMDCHMPVMDGYEATRLIRQREKPTARTPIYALATSVTRQDYQECAHSGMNGVLPKPVPFEQLVEVLNSLR